MVVGLHVPNVSAIHFGVQGFETFLRDKRLCRDSQRILKVFPKDEGFSGILKGCLKNS